MFRRRRPLARLAVGAATAGVALNAGRRPHAHHDDAQVTRAPRVAPPQQYVPPPALVESELDKLTRLDSLLSSLHDSGALTDAEFATAKVSLLGH